MQTKTSPNTPTRRRRRARGAPDGDLLGALAHEETTARQLADDLAALVAAGLIAPSGDGDELRFALVPGGEAA